MSSNLVEKLQQQLEFARIALETIIKNPTQASEIAVASLRKIFGTPEKEK